MKFDKQDPRITAYALGEELSAADHTFIQEIENTEEFKQLVEEIQTTGNAFASLFEGEASAQIPIEPEEIIANATSDKKVVNFPTITRALVAASGAIAAIFVALIWTDAGFQQGAVEPTVDTRGVTVVAPPPPIEFEEPPPQEQSLPMEPESPVEYSVADLTKQSAGDGNGSSPVLRLDNFSAETVEVKEQIVMVDGFDGAVAELSGLGSGSIPPEPLRSRLEIRQSAEPSDTPQELPAVEESLLKARRQFVDGDYEGASETVADVMSAEPNNTEAARLSRTLAERVNRASHNESPEILTVASHFTPRLGVSVEESVLPGGASHSIIDIRPDTLSPPEPFNREGYDRIEEKDFLSPLVEPLSTFSIDVDTASYANVRRFIQGGQLPPPDAVRIEELINYFDYDYPRPEKVGENLIPFTVNTDVGPAPWNPNHHLVRVGLQGYEIPWKERPASNLVFLVDVSGSMSSANKLGLVKKALNELVQKLDERDRVAIVTYAGRSGLALPSTTANNHATIEHALNNLKSGGSTNGAQGIQLAYQVAQEHFVEGGNNRVILCTDGDFNVGMSDRGQLTRLIEDKAKSGVFLSICGFGMGNYQDGQMEALSNKGNGNYAYIDSFAEAQKVFGEDLTGTLITIAKDVKIQVEFNPSYVKAYRLIGYENRALAKEDFNDDTKDAGEIGAGHSVTALYEIVMKGADTQVALSTVDPLKYQSNVSGQFGLEDTHEELLTVKLRYKAPDGDTSQLIEHPIHARDVSDEASNELQFISAIAEFGLLLRGSKYAPEADWKSLIERVQHSLSDNPSKERSEFLNLAKQAQQLER